MSQSIMNTCGVCVEVTSAIPTETVYSAVYQGRTRSMGNQIETREEYSEIQKHEYSVCEDCLRRAKLIPILAWSITGLIAVSMAISSFVLSFRGMENEILLPALGICAPVLLLGGAYGFIQSQTIQRKLKKRAKKDRSAADPDGKYTGLTEREYKKLLAKQPRTPGQI